MEAGKSMLASHEFLLLGGGVAFSLIFKHITLQGINLQHKMS